MRFKFKSGRAIAIASLAFFISFCTAAEVRVRDDLGRELVLATPARRIVSLAPHNTENLFSAGAGNFVVGTVDHSDFPSAALDIPRVGNYTRINIEAILKLNPDLIVAWSSGNPDESVQRLEELGIPVFYSEPTTFELIISNIERLARLSGQQAEVAPRIEQMRSLINRLADAYSAKPTIKIFYQVWDQPLITLNGQHSVSRAIELCGGRNIFADQPSIAPRINVEGVIARNPELILLAGHNNAQSLSWIANWMKWPTIDAVAHQQVKYIDADIVNRPTQRFLQGTRTICELIDAARR